MIFYLLMQVTDRSTSLLIVHAHLKGVQLRPTCVILYKQNILLLEPDRPINIRELLLKHRSYTDVNLIAKLEFFVN